MHFLDFITIGLYLAVILSIGFFYRKFQSSRKEFFVAGGNMGWFVVGLSVMATLFSSNSFVFYPSAAFGNSLRLALSLVAFSLMTPIVIWVFIPVYARLKVETAYEYLERRYHVSVRTLASALFVLLRIGWMASATFAASLVVASVAGVNQVTVILVLGAVAIGYTMMGGLRAVMWTDVIQFFIFALTIVISVGLIVIKSGSSTGEMFHTYFDGRQGLIIDFKPSMTLAFGSWAILIGIFLEGLSAFGVDQVAVQRYLSAKSEKTSQIGAAVNLAGMWIVLPGLLMIGVALYHWYHLNPADMASLESGTGNVPDRALPEFVRLHFPPGLAGLFLAALIAAIMSSIDSGIHSVTTALVVDFRDRLFPKLTPATARGEVWSIRWLLMFIGVISVGLACLVGPLGDVFTIGKKLTSAFGGPLLAIFILALFSKRSTWQGVLVSVSLATIATLALMYICDDWFSVWFWPIGFSLSLVLGWLVSFIFPRQETRLTYRKIMKDHPRQ